MHGPVENMAAPVRWPTGIALDTERVRTASSMKHYSVHSPYFNNYFHPHSYLYWTNRGNGSESVAMDGSNPAAIAK